MTALLSDPSGFVRKALRRIIPEPSVRQEFIKSARRFAEFLHECRLDRMPPGSGDPVGLVVSPWFGTPVPWYSIALAVGLARRGRNIVLIWDDLAHGADAEFTHRQNEAIKQILEVVASRLTHLRLSQQMESFLSDEDHRQIDRVGKLTLTWALRAAPPTQQDHLGFEDTKKHLATTLARIRSLFAATPLAHLVIPGGVINASGMFVYACQQAGLRYSTYDANLGVVQVSHDGIASQQSDVERAFDELLHSSTNEKAVMLTAAKTAFDQRVQARDQAAYQLAQPAKSGEPSISADVLIPMNVEWDSAALGKHVVFEDTVEWLASTITFVLEKFPHCTVAVRQHPSERRVLEQSQFDVARLLDERFGKNPRLQLIRATDEINTYDLMDAASVVLPFVSTIGIEAAALGKVVIVSGASYYSKLGFVREPQSRTEYFHLLELALAGDLPLQPGQIEKAWLCYYLTPVCNRVWTQFTPQPVDFPRWSTQKPHDLYNDPAVIDIITAIDQEIPLSLVRHKRQTTGLTSAR